MENIRDMNEEEVLSDLQILRGNLDNVIIIINYNL